MTSIQRSSVIGLFVLVACPAKQSLETQERSEPLRHETIPLATSDDIPPLDTRTYARSLAQQLDVVPTGSDWIAIRDLQPLLNQARVIEAVLAGPLTRALPGLMLPAEDQTTLLSKLRAARQTLELVLAGIESAGLALDQGLVISELDGEPLISFAAADLQNLSVMASLVDPSLDLSRDCKPIEPAAGSGPPWWTCSLGGAEVLARYQPGRVGEQLASQFGVALPGVAIERINVALSSRTDESSARLVVGLRTDPGLWELSMPLPGDLATSEDALLATGPAPALRSLVPGAGFVWGRLHPVAAEDFSATSGIFTGELFVAPLVEKNALIARAGVSDRDSAAALVEKLASALPSGAIEPDAFAGLKIDIDRKPIDLEGKLIPALGFAGGGEKIAGFEQALRMPARARLWTHGEYLSVGFGEVDGLAVTLERQRGEGLSPTTAAALPPTLAGALLDRQVGAVVHFVLDPWQAPLSDSELAEFISGIPQAQRPDPATIGQVFVTLAPWSSVSVWLLRSRERDPWIIQLSMVPFVAPGPGITKAEIEASAAALTLALTGVDAQPAYRELLARFPNSPRAASWRARVGEAPDSFVAMGVVQVGAVGLLIGVVRPALAKYLERVEAAGSGADE